MHASSTQHGNRVTGSYHFQPNSFFRDDTPVVFTHGDINPQNILISTGPNPQVVAVLDWSQAGWYPAYWEFCKARQGADKGVEFGERIFLGFWMMRRWGSRNGEGRRCAIIGIILRDCWRGLQGEVKLKLKLVTEGSVGRKIDGRAHWVLGKHRRRFFDRLHHIP